MLPTPKSLEGKPAPQAFIGGMRIGGAGALEPHLEAGASPATRAP